MQINLYTDYAYRVLLFLAVNTGDRVTIADITSYYGISHEHLRKVVHSLAKHGYIQTFLGKGGGMELKRKPVNINLGHIFIDFEGIDGLIDCVNRGCSLTPVCSLDHILTKAQKAFLNELKMHSLADLLRYRNMVQLLKVK